MKDGAGLGISGNFGKPTVNVHCSSQRTETNFGSLSQNISLNGS